MKKINLLNNKRELWDVISYENKNNMLIVFFYIVIQ
jgi:hypothetical protein